MTTRSTRPGSRRLDRRSAVRGAALAAAGTLSAIGVVSGQEPPAAARPQPPIPDPAFPYETRHVDLGDGRMAYVELGDPAGRPVLFIHGLPTWSYLWRNVLPHAAAPGRRLIAIDLMGFGRSDKAMDGDIGYLDHVRFLERFIDALRLEGVTLVVHDWGAAVGLGYAEANPRNIAGVAFMEGVMTPVYPRPNYESFGSAAMIRMFRAFRDPTTGVRAVMDENAWVERLLPMSSIRPLGEGEMAFYREPWPTPPSRRPIYRLVQDNPIGGEPADVTAAFERVGAWWRASRLPKLFLYASPGRIFTPARHLPWMRENLQNLETAFVGHGIHFLQEDEPEAIGRAVDEWLRHLPPAPA